MVALDNTLPVLHLACQYQTVAGLQLLFKIQTKNFNGGFTKTQSEIRFYASIPRSNFTGIKF